MKKTLVVLLKVSISLGILAYLVFDATREREDGTNVFLSMVEQPKRWDLLAAAWVCSSIAVLITFVRWCYLVRALGVSLSMRDALRIGFLGYLFNLAPMGIVGGDVLKAVMLGRERPGYRARAVASVVVDRIIGLYVLFVVASAGILLTGFWRLEIREVQVICQAVLLLTVVGTVGIGVLMIPTVTAGRWTAAVARLPRIGRVLGGLIEAMQMYRRNPGVLLGACLMTVGVHCLFTFAVYLIACGLPGNVLSLGTHFVVYPISSVASTLPLPAGPFEAVLEFLYTHVPAGFAIPKGQGLVVALVFRLMGILLAAAGFCYYLSCRGEVAAVMHEAEAEERQSPRDWSEDR